MYKITGTVLDQDSPRELELELNKTELDKFVTSIIANEKEEAQPKSSFKVYGTEELKQNSEGTIIIDYYIGSEHVVKTITFTKLSGEDDEKLDPIIQKTTSFGKELNYIISLLPTQLDEINEIIKNMKQTEPKASNEEGSLNSFNLGNFINSLFKTKLPQLPQLFEDIDVKASLIQLFEQLEHDSLKEEVKSKITDTPKLAMISQPMANKSPEQIRKERLFAETWLKERGYKVINTYYGEHPTDSATSLNMLGRSLQDMSHCSLVYFTSGWETSRGCKIEHQAAEAYGLDIIDLR